MHLLPASPAGAGVPGAEFDISHRKASYDEFEGNEDDDDDDHDDDDSESESRPNCWTGAPSTWLAITASERQQAAALEQLRNANLSIHLYNAFALRKRAKALEVSS